MEGGWHGGGAVHNNRLLILIIASVLFSNERVYIHQGTHYRDREGTEFFFSLFCLTFSFIH